MVRKRILFLSGTRADYGKIKSLIQAVEAADDFETFIYVSGMHLLEQYGSTYEEIINDGYKNIYVAYGYRNIGDMSYDLGTAICNLTGYVEKIKPDMIVVHGDRIDALAGALVGVLKNIMVAHIEGGELSGTVDESIRHTISKLAHVHFVCNKEAKNRLAQMGEQQERIHILGSPDIDIMKSDRLPSLEKCKKKYNIGFDDYAIFMYHPVTTEFEQIPIQIKSVVDALIESGNNYVIIYPNNDSGTDYILHELKRFNTGKVRKRVRIFPSIRFEYFLTLLKNASFMIGNSSAGVRETCVYGIPSIDIGSRQQGRYSLEIVRNIQHIEPVKEDILSAIRQVDNYRKATSYYGDGKSTERFMSILRGGLWNLPLQKKFIDIDF